MPGIVFLLTTIAFALGYVVHDEDTRVAGYAGLAYVLMIGVGGYAIGNCAVRGRRLIRHRLGLSEAILVAALFSPVSVSLVERAVDADANGMMDWAMIACMVLIGVGVRVRVMLAIPLLLACIVAHVVWTVAFSDDLGHDEWAIYPVVVVAVILGLVIFVVDRAEKVFWEYSSPACGC